MTIFRVEHRNNYTVVNNFICKDNRLSWKAKGIWLYAFSRPNDWEFNLTDLINQSTDGRESVSSGLKELEQAGYLQRQQKREDGKFSKADWVFYETPQELKKCLPNTENPFAVNPPSGNQPLLSTDQQSTEDVCYPSAESTPSAPPLSRPSDPPGIVFKKAVKGPDHRVEHGELIRRTLKIKCTTDQIQEAWRVLVEYPNPIYDPYLFYKQTLENIIIQEKSKRIKEAQCKQKQTEKTSQTEKPQNSSQSSSEENTPKRPLVNMLDLIEEARQKRLAGLKNQKDSSSS